MAGFKQRSEFSSKPKYDAAPAPDNLSTGEIDAAVAAQAGEAAPVAQTQGEGPSQAEADTRHLESLYKKVFGESMLAESRATVFSLAANLGIKPSDSLWIALFALQFYDNRLVKFPHLVDSALKKTIGEAAEAGSRAARDAAEGARAEIARIMNEMQESASGKFTAPKWLCSVFAVGFLIGQILPQFAFVKVFSELFFK